MENALGGDVRGIVDAPGADAGACCDGEAMTSIPGGVQVWPTTKVRDMRQGMNTLAPQAQAPGSSRTTVAQINGTTTASIGRTAAPSTTHVNAAATAISIS